MTLSPLVPVTTRFTGVQALIASMAVLVPMRCMGGADNDTYTVDNAGDQVNENLNEGTDLVNASISYTLGANVENLTLTGTANLNGTGNGLANVITGNAGDNVLSGGPGNDRLVGGAGNDTLIGGIGNDTLTGGLGADVFVLALDGSLDTLTDFAPTLGYTIRFDGASFGIPSGSAVASYVTLVATAPDKAHGYILANNSGLYWDADGSGSGATVKIATFQTAPAGLSFASFTLS